jgi:hypothetical protein
MMHDGIAGCITVYVAPSDTLFQTDQKIETAFLIRALRLAKNAVFAFWWWRWGEGSTSVFAHTKQGNYRHSRQAP